MACLARKNFTSKGIVVLLAFLALYFVFWATSLQQSLAAGETVEQSDPRVYFSGSWLTWSDPSVSGGSEYYSKTAGEYALFAFTGTSVSWKSTTAYNRGIAKVYVDGSFVQDVDLYDPSLKRQQTVFSKSGLSNGNHILKVEVTGTKNASSSDSYIGIDVFVTDGAGVLAWTPYNVTVEAPADGERLIIRWQNPPVPNFSYVEIEREDSRIGTTRILPITFASSPAEDRDLSGGVSYFYRLRAMYGDNKQSDWTKPVSATPYAPAPSGVSVENEGSGGKLVIIWTKPPAGIYESIRIYRSTVAGSLGIPVSLDVITGTSYVDTGLTNGVTYYYTVRAVDFAKKESLNADQHSGVPSATQTRYEGDSPSITYSGTWKDYFGDNFSGGGTKVNNQVGSSATLTFANTSIAWVATRGFNMGIAKVYIDAIYQASIDLYSPNLIYRTKVYTKTGLRNTSHSIKIEVAGVKNAAATDTWVDIDAFDLDPTPSSGITVAQPAPAPTTTPTTPTTTTAAAPTPVAGVTAAGSGEIVGRVVNRAGQTIPGTAVRVNTTVMPTNPGGEFRFTLVAAGVYTVYYDAPGYRGQTQMIEVKSGQSTRCPTVIMDPGITPSVQGEIFGRVVNPAHQPIANAAVRINSVVVPTNAAGEFRFSLINPGVYTIYYDAAGYAGQTQILEVKAGMVTYPPMVIMSGTLGEIYGRVLDVASRRPILGTAVRVNSSVMPTNPGGEFRFTLVHPGIYKVYYDAPGYKGQIQETIAVFAGTTTICPTVLMSK